MAVDPRRLDELAKVVSDERRHLNDVEGTLLSRLSAHTHAVYAALVHTHPSTDITSATLHEARYEQTSAQSIANATDSKLAFNNPIYTCTDVTASGTNNTDFALGRAGLWRVSASMRLATGTTGERDLFLATGTTVGTLANRIAGAADGAIGGGAGTLSVSTEIRVTAGTSVFAGTFQNNGGPLSTDVGFGHTIHIALTWLRP
jgi:hypothetical protein